MKWKNILKINIRNLKDAKRVARDYAPEDLIEGLIITQEEYDKLSNEEKYKYHARIFREYLEAGLSDKKEARWHSTNYQRLRNKPEKAVHKPHPTEEEDFKHLPRGRKPKKTTYRSILQGTGRRKYGPRTEAAARQLEGYKTPRKPRPKKPRPKKPKPEPKPKPKPPKPINRIIVDYFTIYNNRLGRNPTLQEIQEDEGRPLTVDEIESFERYAQSR